MDPMHGSAAEQENCSIPLGQSIELQSQLLILCIDPVVRNSSVVEFGPNK